MYFKDSKGRFQILSISWTDVRRKRQCQTLAFESNARQRERDVERGGWEEGGAQVCSMEMPCFLFL